MKNQKVLYVTQAAIVAALYVVFTFFAYLLGIDKMVVQVRFSEALCVLPFFIPSAVPGLFIGCLISNLIFGAQIWDIIFGSIATLIGAYIAGKIKNKWLVPLPTVISNTVIVPLVLVYAYRIEQAYPIAVLGVFAGEVISCYILGMLLLLSLEKYPRIFKK